MPFVCTLVYAFHLEVPMVEILVQSFVIKFVRNLGSNDRCMHRLITRRTRRWAGEEK